MEHAVDSNLQGDVAQDVGSGMGLHRCHRGSGGCTAARGIVFGGVITPPSA
jgi:hypothetical protein